MHYSFSPRSQDDIELEDRLFYVREARRRGNSKWARDYWTLAETILIRKHNQKQQLRGLLINAELV